MKNKRQLYLLGGIVLLCLLYFLIPDPSQSDEKRAIVLAEVPAETVKTVIIENLGEVITLTKKAGEWKLGTEEFNVDESKFDKLFDLATQEWKLEVVSTSEVYYKYGLDEETRTGVTLKDDADMTLRQVYIGETGNRFNVRYVLLEDDPRVLQTFGELGFTFDVKAADLRSRDMVAITSGTDVRSLRMTRLGKGGQAQGRVVTFIKQTKALEEEPTAEAEGAEASPAPATTEDYDWVDEKGKAYKRGEVDDIVNTLVSLRASTFVDEKTLASVSNRALVTYDIITAESGVSEATVYLISKEEDLGYLTGVSTQSTLFRIPVSDGERLDVKVKDLLAP